MSVRSFIAVALFCLLAPATGIAATAPFDLAGPTLEVNVTRGGVTLPISAVPSLAVGDRVALKAELPPAQSARYMLVTAFLRGATDPPPTSWFHRLDTWDRKSQAGLTLTVPSGAQQVLVFLAPATGGDFATLVCAVRGRPGAFVRASQDLGQASLDRARLDAYLGAIRAAAPDTLKTISPLLSRSLMIKLNSDCFDRLPALEAPCLMKGEDDLVLADGHSTSIVTALTTGSAADLAFQLGDSARAQFGYSSPYIAAAMDIARLLDTLHTADYQYIPALPIARDDHLALFLNTPASFHKPLSVLVTALPAVGPTETPALEPVDPDATYCAQGDQLLLPADGAPLAFATGYARELAVRVKTNAGKDVDLPARPDATAGGFVVDARPLGAGDFGSQLEGTLHGDWGFARFEGPKFRILNEGASPWRIADVDREALVVGRTDAARLTGADADCVQDVTLRLASGEVRPVAWSQEAPDTLLAQVPLTSAPPGPATLLVNQRGAVTPEAIELQALAEAESVDTFTLHAGDNSGVLTGARLDQVAGLRLAGVLFSPGALASAAGSDSLILATTDRAGASRLKAGQKHMAKVSLRDGRTLGLAVVVAPLRPSVVLIDKSVERPSAVAPVAIRLNDPDALTQDAQLTFSVRAEAPSTFSGHESIEVAAPEGGASVTLTAANGLTLEDPHVALAKIDVGKALGASAFGPLQFRIQDGAAQGDWQSLGTLVRLPWLAEVRCARGRFAPCELSGAGLYLIAAVSPDPSFSRAVTVPEGFSNDVLQVPHPTSGRLYLKLRDDPSAVSEASVIEARRRP